MTRSGEPRQVGHIPGQAPAFPAGWGRGAAQLIDYWSASCCWVDFLACVGSRLTGQGFGGPAAAGELVAGQGCWVGGPLRGRIWTRQRRCWVEWTCSGGLAYPSGSSGIGVWSSLRFCGQWEGSLATGPTPHPLGRFVKRPHYSPFHIR